MISQDYTLPMSLAEKQALALRDLAVNVAKAKGVIISTNQPGDFYAYHDARIRIEYNNGKPQALDVCGKPLGSSNIKRGCTNILLHTAATLAHVSGAAQLDAALDLVNEAVELTVDPRRLSCPNLLS
jgi:hypothetical protein